MDLILQQMQYFLASFLCGVLLFFLYDFLRILRLLIAHSLLMNLIEDLIFWIAASILAFQMIFRENNGILRVFSIVAFVAGMYGYFSLAGNRFSSGMAAALHKILWPVGRFAKKVLKKVKNLLKKCYKHFIMKI